MLLSINFSRILIVFLLTGLLGTGCASLSRTEKGAAAGAATGAVVGAAVGKAKGRTARGAILGAVVGGTAGALIGQRMDRQAAELKRTLDDADVERVGEGIIVTFDSGILFDFDSAALRPEARANLDNLAESLSEYAQTEVLIIGHTDAIGSAGYNERLSRRRADAAVSYLKRLGISSKRLRREGRGETEPVASNETAGGRQENRRVEVVIYADEAYREAVQAGL